jgi:imidazolonepropionase-like amidohydrolase
MRLKALQLALAGSACVLFFPALGWAFTPQSVDAAPPAAQDQETAVAVTVIRAKRVVVRPGEVLEETSVMVRDGRIVRIAKEIPLPEGATEIRGEVVCAAFIDPWSALGIEGGVLSSDRSSPATRTSDGLDPYSADHLREEALRAGVTAARLQGNYIAPVSGLGSLVRLDPDADDPEEAILLDDAALGMALGLSVDRGRTFRQLPDGSIVIESGAKPIDVFDRVTAVDRIVSSIESGRSYRETEVEYRHELEEWQKAIDEKTAELEDDFKKAKKKRDKEKEKAEEKGKEFKEEKYKEDKKPKAPKYNEDKAALAKVAEGEIPLVVEVHRTSEIRNLLAGTKSFSRLRLILAGGTEALSCAEELAARKIPVIVWPSLRGSGAMDEYTGHDLSLAAELSEAGVQVLLGSGGRDATATRDLPLLAGLTVGHGFDRDLAFEALTIGAAEAFDVQDRLGSVEIGKDADLLVLTGEPLAPDSRIRYVLCGGRLAITPED